MLTRRSFVASTPLLFARPGRGASRPPNIIYMYADDLGYGDTSRYGATRVHTPNIDRLAAGGIRFTNAHSSAATCTPSRYSVMTGEYAFRRPGTGVLPGYARLIIDPGRFTLPGILKQAGYATAAVGKWHLGLGSGDLDWNGTTQICLAWYTSARASSTTTCSASISGTSGWQQLSVSSTPPSDTAEGRIYLRSGNNTGSAFFDDVTFQ